MAAQGQNLVNWTRDDSDPVEKDGDGRKNNGDPTRLGKYNGRPDQRARKFRIAIRDIMSQEEVMELVKERILLELAGKRQVKIMPTVMKIAAGNYMQQNVKNPEQGWIAPAIHVHMNSISDQQLRDYYEKGTLPEHLKKLLPAKNE